MAHLLQLLPHPNGHQVIQQKKEKEQGKLGVNSNFENVKCLDDAVSVFHQMKLVIPIRVFILNNLINSYCLMHRADCEFLVLSIYLKNGIPFDVVTFTTLIREFFVENKVKDAIELFKKVVQENICVESCRNLDAAIDLLNEMRRKGIPPNIVTHNSMIDGLCKFGQWEKVMTLFSEMLNLNIYPDVFTFSMLIDGLCKEGKVEDAKDVMRHMIDKV
ncbi:pentatricopeptide repeat-containing protein At1g62910-like [Lycium ferocissimum]|uniref:pentatricopeptide repeat-containing protein At1g62910-like n=1 Tax=Lycium ferocissimum TaxID=112874 RepID=UPI0028164041|nr:pentatricopeptide repeat-containing protein At1g62910-like [Lycium ferocissimum]